MLFLFLFFITPVSLWELGRLCMEYFACHNTEDCHAGQYTKFPFSSYAHFVYGLYAGTDNDSVAYNDR